LAQDWSETNNVAAEHPEKLAELVALWWQEAEKYQVLPLDGDVLYRLSVEKPTGSTSQEKFVLYPGGASVPFTATPKTYNRPWSITAEVNIPEGGAQGVLVANGGRTGGYTFFVKDGRLHFLYNWLGRERFWLRTPDPLPTGDLELRYEFEPTGAPNPALGHGVPARGQLYVNGELVASIDMPFSVLRMFGTQGLSCGYDGGEPAAPEEYRGAFPFTGTIKRVTIDLAGELIPDTEAELKIAMMRQ
jgi:arylsulfatase